MTEPGAVAREVVRSFDRIVASTVLHNIALLCSHMDIFGDLFEECCSSIRQSMIEGEVDMELALRFLFQAKWLAEIAGPMLQWLMYKTNTSRII
jgi:hypothetical protein